MRSVATRGNEIKTRTGQLVIIIVICIYELLIVVFMYPLDSIQVSLVIQF